MQTSDDIDKIAPALVKAQGDLLHAVKDSNNEAFKRGGKALKYADLAAHFHPDADLVRDLFTDGFFDAKHMAAELVEQAKDNMKVRA